MSMACRCISRSCRARTRSLASSGRGAWRARESGAQRRAPVLSPARPRVGAAAAIAAPALEAVRAAPRGAVEDLRLVRRGKQLQRLCQVDQLQVAALRHLADRRRQRFVAAFLVVTEGLAVARPGQHLVVAAVAIETALEAGDEIVAAPQAVAEGDGARDGPVVEEDAEPRARGQPHLVRPRGIETRLPRVAPLSARGAPAR